MTKRFHCILFVIFVSASSTSAAQPNAFGQTGLVYMPDARIAEDGTWRIGISETYPYTTFWSSVAILPRFEFTGRYTRVEDLPGFLDDPGFGDFKDKAFDAKYILLKEGALLPQLAVGSQDFLGTQVFPSEYVVANKQIGNFDMSVGWGRKRIHELFGGIRYQPPRSKRWSFALEYDANDYEYEFTGTSFTQFRNDIGTKKGGFTQAIAYQYGWLGAQLSNQRGDFATNLSVSIPLMDKEFIPKIREPHPPVVRPANITRDQWHKNPRYSNQLTRALEQHGFQNVESRLEGQTLHVRLTHSRIQLIGRVVGRAVRIVLSHGPKDVDRVHITYTENDLGLLTYEFTDSERLKRYFQGLLSRHQLNRYIHIVPADPRQAQRFHENPEYAVVLSDTEQNQAAPSQAEQNDSARLIVEQGDQGDIVSIKSEDATQNQFRLVPFKLNAYLNDPSGAFHYDIYALASYSKRFSPGFYLYGSARVTLAEDVSEVTIESNSVLPHVRTDVAKYKQEGPIKLNSLLINRFLHPGKNWYARVSVGIYEEMFGGFGGQVLYLPNQQNWAFDLSVDRLRQRGFEGDLSFQDYETTTAIGALHYRMPTSGITTTLRGGRFLAKDSGARIEFKRKFYSGVELGAWYTYTDGKDITSPGTPDSPYRDKGVFVSIPLNSMLTKDTRAMARLSIAPWTRDVGQMVSSPGDLYPMAEGNLLLDSAYYDPMTDFGQ